MKKHIHLITALLGMVFFTAQGLLHAQSLLTTPPETPYQKAARETVLGMQGMRNANLGMLKDIVSRTFGTDDHQAVMDLLGVHAVAVVTNYESARDWMIATLTANGDTAGVAEVATIDAQVPELIKNEDGTVTVVIPEPEPTPTPEP